MRLSVDAKLKLTVILYVALGVSFIGGEYHAFKKHGASDGIFGAMMFPWGIYRGVESLWHDDFAGVDWNKRTQTDMQNCFYFLAEKMNDDRDQIKYNEQIKKFAIDIKKYPPDTIQILKDGSKIYCEFMHSSTKDMLDYMAEYTKTKTSQFKWSENTSRLENELGRYKMKEIVLTGNRSNEMMIKNFEAKVDAEGMRTIPVDAVVSFALDVQRSKMESTYKYLFDIDLNLKH